MVGADENKKKRLLEDILGGDQEAPIIVFVKEKKNCEPIAKELGRLGVTFLSGYTMLTVIVDCCYFTRREESRTARDGSKFASREESGCPCCH